MFFGNTLVDEPGFTVDETTRLMLRRATTRTAIHAPAISDHSSSAIFALRLGPPYMRHRWPTLP
jgi:hypothetical protein